MENKIIITRDEASLLVKYLELITEEIIDNARETTQVYYGPQELNKLIEGLK